MTMFKATFTLDGIDITVAVSNDKDIAISFDRSEPVHLTSANAMLFASALDAAVSELEENS